MFENQDLIKIDDAEQRYLALGNAVADEQATMSCKCLFPDVVQQFETRHKEHARELDLLERTYRMILELQDARSRASQNQISGDVQQEDFYGFQGRLFEALCPWTIAHPWSPPETWDTTWLNSNAWGVGIMHAVLCWLRSCTWPDHSEIDKDDIGISWTEIAVAIMLHHGQVLPIKRLKGNELYVMQPKTDSELQLAATSMSEQSRNAYTLVQHCWSFIPQAMLPAHVEMGKTKSLYYQGHDFFTTGLKRRPSFEKQKEVSSIIGAFLPLTNRRLEGMPSLSFDTFSEHPLDIEQRGLNWNARDKRAKKALVAVRKSR